MRGDDLVQTQLLMAQAFTDLASTVANSNGMISVPVNFADLTDEDDAKGMVACINDSNVDTWGSVISGGGSFTVLAFFNGVSWTVMAK